MGDVETAPTGEGAAVGEKRKVEETTGANEDKDDIEETNKNDANTNSGKRLCLDKIKLGPKEFSSADDLFRFFSTLLAEQTINQDINEVRKLIIIIIIIFIIIFEKQLFDLKFLIFNY